MDTGWVQVFVLTLAECVAPTGKSVCQQDQFELQFFSQEDCEFALQQLIELKSASEQVIVDKARSGCAPTAVRGEVFPSLAAARTALSNEDGWREPEPAAAAEANQSLASHQERLDSLKTCDESGGVAPCKIGDIIIEGASQQVEVWRQN